MLPIKQLSAPVEGNREVCELLEGWLKRAKHGDVNFVGLVVGQSPTQAFIDHAGVSTGHFAAYVALDQLKERLTKPIMDSQYLAAPVSDSTLPANMVCYDISVEPLNYDFLVWLVTMEMRRRAADAPAPLRVAFIKSPTETNVVTTLDDQRRKQQMFDHVLGPLVSIVGGVIDPTAALGHRSDLYCLSEIVERARNGETVPSLFTTQSALASVDHILQGASPVVITLREAEYWEHRNSNLQAWTEFARCLASKGERVIFVRDTARAKEPIPGFETCPLASTNLDVRVALYERAACNLFVGNGPWTLSIFSSRPWIAFNAVDSMDPYTPNSLSWWKKYHGITKDEQFPWSGPDQRIVWKADTFENILEAWNAQ